MIGHITGCSSSLPPVARCSFAARLNYGVMKKLFFLALLLSSKAVGWRGPETTVVTPENANQYQFELEKEDSGEQSIDAFTLRFHAQLENGCMAGRVQT